MKNSIKLFLVLSLFVIFNNNSYSQWTATNGPGELSIMINALAESNGNIFAGTLQGVFITTNNGVTWNQTAPGITDFVMTLVVSNGYIFAGTLSSGLFRSSNNGTSWEPANNGLGNSRILKLAEINDQHVFVSTLLAGVFKSTNNGDSWTQVTNVFDTISASAFYNDNGILFAGTLSQGLYKSSDFGNTWQLVSTSSLGQSISSIAVSDAVILVGTQNHGVYRSTDNGLNWTNFLIGGESFIFTVASHGRNFFAGPFNKGFHASSDYGATWTRMDQGFWNTYFDITSIVITDEYIFAGTSWDTVYKRPKSDLVNISNISLEHPEIFSLHQNYPNPFNPTTNITIELTQETLNAGELYLEIFDIRGAIVNREKIIPDGSLRITKQINLTGNQSGIYFARVSGGSLKSNTIKLVLLK